MSKLAAIILAAGKGTRMKSDRPKVVFELAGKPMINRVVKTAQELKCELITIVVGYKKEQVIQVVPKTENIRFVEQKKQNGTGHAVMVTKEEFKNFKGNLFILCGDVPLLRTQTLQNMLQKHLKSKASCTVLTAKMGDPMQYGRIVRNLDGYVQKIVEFKDATQKEKEINEINTGIYCFDSESLFQTLNKIGNNNNQNEYYLTDILEILNQQGKKVASYILEDMVEASGVNSKQQLAELEQKFYERLENEK
ncbi:MAG: sugar phosphate nucleotidyltransferase [Candidatus Cloacimonadota bacterium]|nr:sugar phosphate nucleotidyltransferase [Candidatus Cloacimonadota bacterium]